MANENGESVNNFLLGALIGGVLGVLFAPQEGSRTREMIKLIAEDTLKDFQDNAEKNALKARIISEDTLGKLQKTATEVREKVEEALPGKKIGSRKSTRRTTKKA